MRLTAVLTTALVLLLLAAGPAVAAESANEPPSEPILRLETGMHTAPIKRLGVDRDGRWLLTASDDKTARLWDLANGRLLHTYRPPIGAGNEGKFYAGVLSPDGLWVALSGYTGNAWDQSFSIYLFERDSGRLLRRLTGLPQVINHLAFSPNGRWLAAGLGGKTGIRLWRTDTWALAGEDREYKDQVYGLDFRADGQRLAATSLDGSVRLYAIQASGLERLARRPAPGGKQPYAIRFHPAGDRLVVGYHDVPRVDVLDAETLEPDHTPDLAGLKGGNLSSVAWSSGRLWAGGMVLSDGQRLRVWARDGHGTASAVPVMNSTVLDLKSFPDGLVWGSGDPAWGMVDATGQTRLRQSAVIADLRGSFEGFQASHDGAQVRFGYEPLGKSPTVFDIRQRRFIAPDPAGLSAPNTTRLAIRDWANTRNPSLDGQPLTLQPYEISRSLAIAPDGARFVLGADWALRLFDRQGRAQWEHPAPGVVWGVNVTPDGKTVIAAYGDGTIRWHRLSDGKELLAFFPHADRKRWVLWTPKGYFVASEGAEDLIGWHVNQGKDREARFVNGRQLYDKLYRPDLIQRLVDGEDPDNLPPVNLTELLATGATPTIEILSPKIEQSSDRDVTLRYRVCDAGGGIGDRVLRLNQMVIGTADKRALKLVGKAGGEGCTIEERLISLQPGQNRISVTAFNKDKAIESLPAEQVITFTGQSTTRPRLHILAFAVDRYRDGDLRLAYSRKDAEGLLEHLKKASKDLFLEVRVNTLYDDAVRLEPMAQAFDKAAKEVGPDDVFVLYMAGHGVTDREDGNYYFLPVNSRYTDPAAVRNQGISNQFFQTNLAKIRAGKSLVLLDTCNSGGFGALKAKTRGIEEKTAVTRLVKATGRTTLMASANNQVALEGYQGHGVFTWSLLEGLKGKAAGRDRQITVGGLADYISEVVPELTYKQFGYEQVPQREMSGMNFPIGTVP